MAAKFEIKKAKNGQFMFNLKAGNGEIILTSEMYTTKAACQNGIESVQKNSKDEKNFEIRESKKGEPYFVLKAANHQIIGNSEMYSGTSACKNGIASVQTNGKTKEISDLTLA